MKSTIGDQLNGRNNNFNLIRFLAATAVVYNHCFNVIQGKGLSWIVPYIKVDVIGLIAVDIFFVLSGFLITKSWYDNPNLLRFFLARVLRIFPALFAVAIVTALVIGPVFSSWLPIDYYLDLRTWMYIPVTGTMIADTATLPGVFEAHVEKQLVNLPLWTLKYELLSYVLIGLLGGLALLTSRERALVVIGSLAMVYLVVQCLTDWRDQHVIIDNVMRFWTFFLLGSVFYLLRDKIELSAKTGLLLAVVATALHGTPLFELAFGVALAYAVMWFALVPSGTIRNFNSFGDYSYGLYIFAWPIQQATVQAIPGLDPQSVFAIVFPIVLLLAVASWHLLEKPCLGSRGKIYTAINSWTDRIAVRFSSHQTSELTVDSKSG